MYWIKPNEYNNFTMILANVILETFPFKGQTKVSSI